MLDRNSSSGAGLQNSGWVRGAALQLQDGTGSLAQAMHEHCLDSLTSGASGRRHVAALGQLPTWHSSTCSGKQTHTLRHCCRMLF